VRYWEDQGLWLQGHKGTLILVKGQNLEDGLSENQRWKQVGNASLLTSAILPYFIKRQRLALERNHRLLVQPVTVH